MVSDIRLLAKQITNYIVTAMVLMTEMLLPYCNTSGYQLTTLF